MTDASGAFLLLLLVGVEDAMIGERETMLFGMLLGPFENELFGSVGCSDFSKFGHLPIALILKKEIPCGPSWAFDRATERAFRHPNGTPMVISDSILHGSLWTDAQGGREGTLRP